MRGAVRIVVLGLTALPLMAQPDLLKEQQARRPWTMAKNNGFEGPIHTAKSLVRHLANDPRPPRHEIPINTSYSWMAFDTGGNIVESAARLDETGRPEGVQHQTYDASGHVIETTTEGSTAQDTHEYAIGPSGITEDKTYRNGKPLNRITTEYDQAGRVTRSCVYDDIGELVNESESKYDAEGHAVDWVVRGQENALVLHLQDTFDADSNIHSRTWLDEDDLAIRSFTVTPEGTLSNWWQAPLAKGERFSINDSARGVSRDFIVTDAGQLLIQTEDHRGRAGNLHSDTVDLRTEDGRLIEKVTYTYDWDAYHNWTRRIVSVWDAKRDTMVPVEEDDRVLTYYGATQ